MSTYARVIVGCPSLSPTLDGFSNGFTFKSEAVIDWSGVAPLLTAVHNFYNAVGTGGSSALATYMAESLDRTANHGTTEIYDATAHLAGTPMGAPVASANWTLAAARTAQTSYPEGVAAVLSYRADYGTDVEFGTGTRPRARDRNRLYLGPLNSSAFQNETTTNRCQFTAAFQTDIRAALFDLSQTIDPTGQAWVLQIWSRVNAATKLPTECWTDDRPDYQRRRSDPSPASRTYRPLSAP